METFIPYQAYIVIFVTLSCCLIAAIAARQRKKKMVSSKFSELIAKTTLEIALIIENHVPLSPDYDRTEASLKIAKIINNSASEYKDLSKEARQ